jgi:hypothetical protein
MQMVNLIQMCVILTKRTLIISSPLSPVMPRQKCRMVLVFASEFPIFQPDPKKPKIQDNTEGIPALYRLEDHN